MKKLSVIVLFAILSSVPALSQTLLSTSFDTKEEFNAWTVVNCNKDAATWCYVNDDTAPSKVVYPYNGAEAADDWLMSPVLTPVKTGYVAVKYSVYGSKYIEKMEIMYGASATVDAMTNRGTEVTEYKDDITTGEFLIEVEEGVPFYIGFHAVSDADKWRLYLCSVEVVHVENDDLTGVENVVIDKIQPIVTVEHGKIVVAADGLQQLLLYDLCGSLVNASDAQEISTHDVNAGIYVLVVKTQQGSYTVKVLLK